MIKGDFTFSCSKHNKNNYNIKILCLNLDIVFLILDIYFHFQVFIEAFAIMLR